MAGGSVEARLRSLPRLVSPSPGLTPPQIAKLDLYSGKVHAGPLPHGMIGQAPFVRHNDHALSTASSSANRVLRFSSDNLLGCWTGTCLEWKVWAGNLQKSPTN